MGLGSFFLEECVAWKTEMEREAYERGVEKGIELTYATLYDANISDEEILRVVKKYINIDDEEAINRLNHEKRQAAIRELKEHLRLSGYSKKETHELMLKNNAAIKIGHMPLLRKFKNNPEKLWAEIIAKQ